VATYKAMDPSPLSPALSLDPFASQQNAQANPLDPFAASKQPTNNTVTQGMTNLDPFSTENTPPAPQPSLDPFALPQIAAAPPAAALPAVAPTHPAPHNTTAADMFDPFAPPPAQQQPPPKQEEFDALDELDRAEAMAAKIAEEGDDIEYEEDESEEEENCFGSFDGSDDCEDEYDASFSKSDGTLGVLIADSVTSREHKVVVKMVVDGGCGFRECITEGSSLIMVNGTDVRGKTKDECTAMIKRIGRPLTLRFRKPDGRDMMSKGVILARVADMSGGVGFVGNWKRGVATWSDRFYVWGGTNDESLYLFKNEGEFQAWTVQVHKAKKGQAGAGAVAITPEQFHFDGSGLGTYNYSINHIKCKEYKSYGQLFYFALSAAINPPLKVVIGKFASSDRATIERMHETIRHLLRMNGQKR